MTFYQLYRGRAQAAVVCAASVPLAAIALFTFAYDRTKHGVFDAVLMLVPSICFAVAAVLACKLARFSWFEYYLGTDSGFATFLRERREWVRNGYRTPNEIKFGRPPKTRPPADG